MGAIITGAESRWRLAFRGVAILINLLFLYKRDRGGSMPRHCSVDCLDMIMKKMTALSLCRRCESVPAKDIRALYAVAAKLARVGNPHCRFYEMAADMNLCFHLIGYPDGKFSNPQVPS